MAELDLTQMHDDLYAEIKRSVAEDERLEDLIKKLRGHESYVTPEEFGATGDGVEDDYYALQLALNQGKAVLLGGGTYFTSTPLTFNAPAIIGSGSTIKIDSVSASDSPTRLLTCINKDGASFVIDGVRFETDDDNQSADKNPSSNIDCIAAYNAKTIRLSNCEFLNFFSAIYTNSDNGTTCDFKADHCVLDNMYAGFYTNYANVDVDGCRMSFCDYATSIHHFVYQSLGDAEYLRINNCEITALNQSNDDHIPLLFALRYSGGTQNVTSILIQNSRFLNIGIVKNTNADVGSLRVANCVMYIENNFITSFPCLNEIGPNFKNVMFTGTKFHAPATSKWNLINSSTNVCMMFVGCFFSNMRLAANTQNTSTPNENGIIYFDGCTFDAKTFGNIGCKMKFSNCVVEYSGNNQILFLASGSATQPIVLISNCTFNNNTENVAQMTDSTFNANNIKILGCVINSFSENVKTRSKVVNTVINDALFNTAS